MTVATLYTREILALAATLKAERLAGPDVSVTKRSRICGSTVTLDVCFEGDKVKTIGAEVEACALGQAATALLEEHGIGATKGEAEKIRTAMEDLLSGKEAKFPDSWKALEVFTEARRHKGRHSAILLPFKALEEAFGGKK